MTDSLAGKNILLVISGGIAAYKSLELIRLLRKDGARVRCILTSGGAQFITPLSVGAISEEQVYTDLFSLKDETEMGHIRLTREADLVVVAPASANIIAQLANGFAPDLASTTLLASTTPILMAPAMNHAMWHNESNQTNIDTLKNHGVKMIGPNEGDMACGEFGLGRMAEPEEIFSSIRSFFFELPLKGFTALVTSGPTFEPIDPVRFIGNRSSGKQGHAIAQALQRAGAKVTLVSGPTALKDPVNVKTIHVETAAEMLAACEKSLPADIAICAAAVADWRPATPSEQKIKKRKDTSPPDLKLTENPDILKTLGAHKKRPKLLIGFALESENLLENAQQKLKSKGCDWIVANAVCKDENPFGSDENHVYLLSENHTHDWKKTGKGEVARKLVEQITGYLKHENRQEAAE